MRRLYFFAALFLLALPAKSRATVFAAVHGVVHDQQHRPVAGAMVSLQAVNSTFKLDASTDAKGGFEILQVPIGVYQVKVSARGFADVVEPLSITSGTNPVMHIPLAVAASSESVVVHASSTSMATDSVTPTTLITRADIDQTPGATRTIGMEMITDFVPGATMSHDMLHMRGGHQTSWLIDGIAIPNTKIASNVGPQIDPKDIDEIETQRGSYQADVGDRTYGVFNVLPRNGFERDREAELLVSGGNLYTGETQFSLGDHSTATAWYASVTGSRSNYGLETPIASIHHDATNSQSAFVSLIRNQDSRDQLRLDGQYRQDHFQIPYDPNPDDWEQSSQYYQSFGLRDAQNERDSLLIFNWVHTLSPTSVLSVAPFYHANQANYDSQPADQPVATTWHQSSQYAGAQADFHTDAKSNSFSGGAYAFYQDENDLFGILSNDGGSASLPNTPGSSQGNLVEFYLSDHLHLGHYINLLGGERFTFYRGGFAETAIYPRIGATVEIPRLHWVLRGFYGHFFQPAPLQTVSASVLNYASGIPSGQNTFSSLPSERDEEHQFGLEIPWRGWSIDVTTFKNRVNNFLDHANLGASNMYFPIAVDGALVRAWEVSVRSPRIAHVGQFHLAYSNQIAEQRGNIVGGFTCAAPGDPACNRGPDYFPVDHDQRHTLNTGFTAQLPLRSWFSSNVYYGSGFSNGLSGAGVGPYNGKYLPVHTTFDAAAGHSFGERLSLSVSAINVTNHRILQDNSITVGGFHINDPRMLSAQLRYRFHF